MGNMNTCISSSLENHIPVNAGICTATTLKRVKHLRALSAGRRSVIVKSNTISPKSLGREIRISANVDIDGNKTLSMMCTTPLFSIWSPREIVAP